MDWLKNGLCLLGLVSVVLKIDPGNAMTQPSCSDHGSGLSLEELPSAVVALSHATRAPGSDGLISSHIGNGVVIQSRQERFLFLTAHHVLHRACELLGAHPNSMLGIDYQLTSLKRVSNTFRIDNDRCQEISANGFQKGIDLGVFEIPNSVIPSNSPPREAPILDRADQTIASCQYYGYRPFPNALTDDSTLVRTSGSDAYVYAIHKVSDRGWSGMPVFRRMEGARPTFFLAGVIFSSPEIQEVLQILGDQERLTSDRRIGVVAAGVARSTVANQRTLVVPIARYRFDDWVERSSDAVAKLKKLVATPAADLSNDEIREVASFFESLSSSDQFEATAYLLRRMRAEERAIEWPRSLLLALARSIPNWCYYNLELENEVLDLLQTARAPYSQREVSQVVRLVEFARERLKEVYENPEASDAARVYEVADKAFSLLYTEGTGLDLREELTTYDVSGKFISDVTRERDRVEVLQEVVGRLRGDDVLYRAGEQEEWGEEVISQWKEGELRD